MTDMLIRYFWRASLLETLNSFWPSIWLEQWTITFRVKFHTIRFLTKKIIHSSNNFPQFFGLLNICGYLAQYWKWKSLSCVQLFATPWTRQSMAFSRPEYWSGWPFPSPGDLPNPGIKPRSPTLQGDSLPAEPQGSPGILEWVAYPFSSGSSWPRNRTGLLHCKRILYQLRYTKHEEEQNLQQTHETVPGLRVEFPLAQANEKQDAQASEWGTKDHHLQEALFYWYMS